MRFALILTLCLVGVASAGSLNKRDDEGTSNKQAAELKANLEKLRGALLNRWQNKGGPSAGVAVEKRSLRESFDKFNNFALTKTQEAFNNIRRVIDNLFKNPFQEDDEGEVEDTTERSISKRDIFEQLGRLTEMAQAEAQNAFADLQRILDEIFSKHPGSHAIEIEIEDGEVTTERIIEKRNVLDFFGKINEKAQTEVAKIFDLLQKTIDGLFKHNSQDDEDSTEASIVKRDIFDFFGEMNEKIRDQGERLFHRPGPKPGQRPGPRPGPLPGLLPGPRPGPRPGPLPGPRPGPRPVPKPDFKPVEEIEVEEIEVVTAA